MSFIDNLSARNRDLDGVPSTIVITFSSGDEVSYVRKVDSSEEEKLQPSTNIEVPKCDFGKFNPGDDDLRAKYAVCNRTLTKIMRKFKDSLGEAGRLRDKAKSVIDDQYLNWERNLRKDYNSQKEKWQKLKSKLESPEGRLQMVVEQLEETNLEKAPSVIKMLGIETDFVLKKMASVDLRFDTFMSHVQTASGDLCGRLSDALSHAGLTSWYDMNSAKLDMHGIIEGVLDSRIFTVVLTKDYLERQWCLFELSIAVAADKPIIAMHEADPRFEGGHLSVFNIPKQFNQIMTYEIIKIDRRNWNFFFSSFEQAIKVRQKAVSVLNDEIERIKGSSDILKQKSDVKFLRDVLQSSGWKFGKMIFSSIVDGFTVENFHDKCDHKGATLTVVKRDNASVFGAFNPFSWESRKATKIVEAAEAWLFDLTDKRLPKLLDAEFGQVKVFLRIDTGPYIKIYTSSGDEIGIGVHASKTRGHFIKGIFAGNSETGILSIKIDQYEVFQLIKTDEYAST